MQSNRSRRLTSFAFLPMSRSLRHSGARAPNGVRGECSVERIWRTRCISFDAGGARLTRERARRSRSDGGLSQRTARPLSRPRARGGPSALDRGGAAIVLSLRRMNRVREIDPLTDTMIVEGGVTLAEAQAAAQGADRLFPLSLASEGSCTIGGNLSTNAGGVAVLAYGNAR